MPAVYCFGTPAVGTDAFEAHYRSLGLWEATHTFETPLDPVVHSIPRIYRGVGRRRALPYEGEELWEQHTMDAYLEALCAGHAGSGQTTGTV